MAEREPSNEELLNEFDNASILLDQASTRSAPGARRNYDEVRAAVLARMSPGWQDISTAPKDGTRVLLYIPAYADGASVRLGAYAESERWWRTTSGPCPDDARPTMWQPLPAPPSPTTTEGNAP